jgi:regulator of protease activity HflC (stomatin/prohibitin superfamily)
MSDNPAPMQARRVAGVAGEPLMPGRQGVSMLPKMVVILILAVAGYSFAESRPFVLPLALVALVVVYTLEAIRVVPQQEAFVVERLGRFDRILEPGLGFILPPLERVAYRHSLKEVPLEVPEQVCITKDNTQLGVDGIIYFQVTDPRLASYGTSDYLSAITQLAQTTLRSEVGRMELDRTLESRDQINRSVVSVLDEAGRAWGVKVLRYEVKNLTPPEAILRSMQQQITAERERRALVAKSEGERQQEINIAEGEKQAAILRSEGNKTAAVNRAQGEAAAIGLLAEATAQAVTAVAQAINQPGGDRAAGLKVAEAYIAAFGNLAKTNNTMIVPSNLADVSTMVATALSVLETRKTAGATAGAGAAGTVG